MGIKLSNVRKEYNIKDTKDKQIVLNDVSLFVEKGEMVAIKGKSGAGKSTLLHIIGLLDVMDSGCYLLDDLDVGQMNNTEMASIRNKKIGFVLQDYGLIEEETVSYNVGLPLMFGNTKLKDIKDIVKCNLEKIGVSHLSEKKVAVLSGGEKQRVAIARALVNNPDYILADEPTGSLDSNNAKKIITILKQLNSEGKSIIMVTHDDSIANECERIIVIKDGQII